MAVASFTSTKGAFVGPASKKNLLPFLIVSLAVWNDNSPKWSNQKWKQSFFARRLLRQNSLYLYHIVMIVLWQFDHHEQELTRVHSSSISTILLDFMHQYYIVACYTNTKLLHFPSQLCPCSLHFLQFLMFHWLWLCCSKGCSLSGWIPFTFIYIQYVVYEGGKWLTASKIDNDTTINCIPYCTDALVTVLIPYWYLAMNVIKISGNQSSWNFCHWFPYVSWREWTPSWGPYHLTSWIIKSWNIVILTVFQGLLKKAHT